MTTFTPVAYKPELHDHLPQDHKELVLAGEFWESEEHLVIRRKVEAVEGVDMWHLSFRRKDNKPVAWREAQLIKNSVVGPEHQGFEILPPESEKVDKANQYHIWVFANPKGRLPVGL